MFFNSATAVLSGAFILLCVSPLDARCRSVCCCPCYTCSTSYHHGDDDGSLTVEIAGQYHEEIQVFFRHTFLRDKLHHHTHLHCRADIKFARNTADYATFSVRYGDGVFKNRFALYGIPKTLANNLIKITNDPREVDKQQVPLTYFVATDERYPVKVEWISTQVAKITHGRSQSKTTILRFLPDNQGEWVSLDGTPIVNP